MEYVSAAIKLDKMDSCCVFLTGCYEVLELPDVASKIIVFSFKFKLHIKTNKYILAQLFPVQYLGHIYAKKHPLFMKFKFNWKLCILMGKSKQGLNEIIQE
jgi:hypothetical protein